MRVAVAVGVCALLAGLVWAYERSIAQALSGAFTYCVDDAYIHLALGRTLGQAGVWGLTPDGFTAASSSILWTLLLALAPGRELWPLALNVGCGVGAVCVLAWRLRRAPALVLGVAGVALVLLPPLVVMALVGMEHSLQILGALLFLWRFERTIADGRNEDVDAQVAKRAERRQALELFALGALVTATRYEGLFLVAAAFLPLVLRHRVIPALAMGVGAALPVGIFAAVSMSHGWFPLPNSVLVKGATHGPVVLRGLAALRSAPHLWGALALLSGLTALLSRAARRFGGTDRASLALRLTVNVALVTALLHLQFAKLGWFYRYEAWLLAMTIWCAACALGDHGARLLPSLPESTARLAVALGLLVCAGPAISRAVTALSTAELAAKNIHDQQRQMGLFLGSELPGSSVALNDIGGPSYFGKSHILDLVGLASIDVVRALRTNGASQGTLRGLTQEHRVRFALLHAKLFQGAIPPEWVVAGRWRLPDNLVCGEDTVTFFGTSAGAAEELAAALRRFAPRLPEGVEVSVAP